MSELIEPERVEVMVCTPHQPIRLISARLTGQIKALQSLWPESPKRFIFNGAELIEAMTFDFYGIKDGDSIIALPQEKKESVFVTNQWINLTKDNDNFSDSMRWMLDPQTALEAARLRDLHMTKLEKRAKVFMKISAPFLNDEGKPEALSLESYLDYEAATEPSTEALPIFWEIQEECSPQN